MHGFWKVTIEIWPYASFAQDQAGPRELTYVFLCDSLGAALARAKDICVGIHTNPHVWQTPITGVVRHPYQDVPRTRSVAGEIELP